MCFEMVKIFYLVLLNIAMTRSMMETEKLRPPASDFTKYAVVQPVFLHGETKREISTTRDKSGGHHLAVTMKVPIGGEEYFLDLRLNQDLVTDNHVLSYQKNGKIVVQQPEKEDMDLCHYSGSVRDKPGSWVAVSTCHGVQGIVFDGERVRYIEPAQGGDLNSEHYIYNHSDLTESHPHRHQYGFNNSSQHKPRKSWRKRYKRHASSDQLVRGPYQANDRSLYVELTLVADRRHFLAHKYDLRSVYSEMKMIANVINAVFSELNIFIALVSVEVWNDYDKIILIKDSKQVLDNFLNYRRTEMVKNNFLNDFAMLITHQPFEDDVIGKAYIEKICTLEYSGGVAYYHTKVTSLLAMTIAHELGHSFGMDHDEKNSCKCKDRKCIMSSTSTGVVPINWSSCSLNSLALTFSRLMDYCLRNKPNRLLNTPTCGNGFVEPGEQCDCGTPAVANAYNPCHVCCNPRTCRLRANATCGTGNCCDLKTCRLKSVNTICRSADHECDLPEYCTGHSEYCPDDVYKMDATPCGNGENTAYCVNGACQSHLDQCRLLWGPSGKSCPKQTYDYNMKSGLGDCGYDRLDKTYEQCAKRDVMCGRLLCTHLSQSSSTANDLQVGPKDTVRYIQWISPEKVVTCHTVSVDLGLSVVDFGMVPDGAKCGDGMMCLKQKCVSVAAVRERIAHLDSSVCPSDCSGHGVCNSAGHCHCEPGFAPPLCAEPGAGGSYDSGPASDTNILRQFMVAVYVIFLGIVPAIALIMLIIYCWREKGFAFKKKYKCKLSFQCTGRNTLEIKTAKEEPPIYANIKNVLDSSTACSNLPDNIAEGDPPIYANTTIVLSPSTRKANTTAPTNTTLANSSIIYSSIEKKSNQKSQYYVPNANQKEISSVNCTVTPVGAVKKKPRVPLKPGPNLDNSTTKDHPPAIYVKGLNSTTSKMVEILQQRSYNVGNSDLTQNVLKQNDKGRRPKK